MARSEQVIADDGKDWDNDPFLLGVMNGVVDLRTGELREARREDRVTRQVPVKFDPSATCPVFTAFLKRVQPREEIFYEFEATFKIVLLANHKPVVRGTDWAIWRRIKLVPFEDNYFLSQPRRTRTSGTN